MRWKWLAEREYRTAAEAYGRADPRFLDPAFPAASRRCFQVEAHGICVAGVVSKQEKQLFLGGLTNGDPAVMPLVLRFANRLMWQWGCRSSQLERTANALTLDEEKTVWKQKKSGRCREGACRIEWELEEGNIKIGVLRCQIDPLVQRNRLEAQVMTAKLLDVERRGEVIAQIHHWDQLAKKLGPLIDAGGLRFVSRKAQAWISMPIPSPQAADPEYLRDQLARQLAAMGITLCPEPTVDVVRWRRRLFMFTHQKNKQRHLARHTGQAGAGICPQQRRP